MNKPMSIFLASMGVFLFFITHHGINNGRLLIGKGSYTTVTELDSGFWFIASMQLMMAFIFILLGVTYLFSGVKYLPSMERGSPISIIHILIFLVGFILAFFMQFLLPFIYR